MKNQTKEYLRSILVVTLICLVMGLILAGVYALTAPRIAENEKAKLNAAIGGMFPDSTYRELSLDGLPGTVSAVYEVSVGEDIVGYVADLVTKSGYGTSKFTVGIRCDGTVVSLDVIDYGDSVDCGNDFYKEFKDLDRSGVDAVASASPAKYTRRAVRDAVSDALSYLSGAGLVKGGAGA